MTNYHDLLKQAYYSCLQLTIYRKIREDKAVRLFSDLVFQLVDTNPSHEEVIENYHELAHYLMHLYGLENTATSDLWQNHILHLLLHDENIFSLACENGRYENLSFPLKETVQNDFRYLQTLFQINGHVLREALRNTTSIEIWPSLEIDTNIEPLCPIEQTLLASDDWAKELKSIAKHYHTNGCGIFAQFKALRWIRKNDISSLVGVVNADPVQLDAFIGYELQRSEVVSNTLQFLQGLPANNVLLYGDRGTGKSSTVKALVNEYAAKGLRLIEVSKHHLNDLPEIMEFLQNRGLKFIIFVDDLSFEGDETQYRELKSILEGGIEIKPKNVLIYATSNRRHLIKEYFSERSGSDEININDTMQEKLSLADRFGITVTFTAPDQEDYLLIVEGLVKQRNLNISLNKLRPLALQWEMWHHGRSPRTAKQFVDHLEGQLKQNTN